MLVRNRFEPHRLPDPRHSGIPDALRFEHLLSARLKSAVRRVPNRDDELILFLAEDVGDVESKRLVPAAVLAYLLSVHPHDAVPIDGAKVKQQATFRG